MPILSRIFLGLFGNLLVGILVGVLLFFSSKLIYLIFVSAIIAAVIVAILSVIIQTKLRIHWAIPAFILGFIASSSAYTTYHLSTYLDFLRVTRQDILAEDPKADWQLLTDRFLESEAGYTGFIGFMAYQAELGMTVSDVNSYSPNQDDHWGRTGTLLYWLVEWLGMGIMAGLGNYGRAKSPYCHDIDDWLQFKVHGWVKSDDAGQFMDFIHHNDYLQGKKLIQPTSHGLSYPRLQIVLARCHETSPTANLIVQEETGQKNIVLLYTDISTQHYNELMQQ